MSTIGLRSHYASASNQFANHVLELTKRDGTRGFDDEFRNFSLIGGE